MRIPLLPVLLISTIMIGGCATLPSATPAQVAAADVGDPPKDYQSQVKRVMAGLLSSEFEAYLPYEGTPPLYEFQPPYKDYTNYKGQVVFGWRVDYKVVSRSQ